MMWFVILGVLLDQVSKYWVSQLTQTVVVIPSLLSIAYVENRGAVFGVAQGSNVILAIMTILLCTGLLLYLVKQKQKGKSVSFAWYCILTGGIGNLLDRVLRGYVVDFIATPFIATFNIADSFVVIGVFLLLIQEIIATRKPKE